MARTPARRRDASSPVPGAAPTRPDGYQLGLGGGLGASVDHGGPGDLVDQREELEQVKWLRQVTRRFLPRRPRFAISPGGHDDDRHRPIRGIAYEEIFAV